MDSHENIVINFNNYSPEEAMCWCWGVMKCPHFLDLSPKETWEKIEAVRKSYIFYYYL